jgi:X-Pro dipeptidyl-peptidase
MGIRARALAGVVALAGLATAAGPGVASAQGPVVTVQDGVTQPVFSYQDAIRERVFIPVAGVDSDNDGVTDRVAVDIVRPKESGPSLKVPAIIDDSPYYTSLGRGNESQYIHTTPSGVLDKFPLFYDNYFVPRGYAVILAQAVGTAFSTGCPLHGGPGDVAGFKAVVDWTEGRVPGYTSLTGTTPAQATWSNGKNAMIGKSYDGTFANGVAATGVDGLTTIVPISAISDWYDYSRMGGVRFNTHYPYGLSDTITSDRPASDLGVTPPTGAASRNSICGGGGNSPRPGSPFAALSAVGPNGDGDADGDINTFWNDRDYNKDVSKVKAAVFASHGIDDNNVRPNHFSKWWAGLAANGVPRKVWLSQEGHVDPFEYRRTAWVETLHRWFDYWLQGVQNGIMDEPRVDIEQPQGDVWQTYADFPIPGTVDTDVFLAGRTAGTSGSLGLASGGATDTLSFLDANLSTNNAQNSPNGSQANRLVFLTTKLKQDLHISGTPTIDIQASLDKTQSNLTALLVDYGQFNRVGRGGSDGVRTDDDVPENRTCWGGSTSADSACYLGVTKPTTSGTVWQVSKGILDSTNRDSLFSGLGSPLVPGTKYEFKFPVLPTDYTFPAGHQVGVVLLANFSSFSAANGTTGARVTVDTKNSKVILPVTGGGQAATDSAGFVADTTAPTVTPNPNMTVYSADSTGATVTYTPPVATDTQDPNPTVSCTPASGTKFKIGTTTVNCVVTDANGNATPTSFNVTVLFAASANGDVSGNVPATLSLTLGPAATFGAFAPGVTAPYTASTTANVISTAGDALLSVADPSSTATGHLVNGAFFLPQPLQARGKKAGTTGTAFNNVGSSASPLNLLTWSAPVSNDPVTLEFQQLINANDALRTGSYSKTLTYTLSTTNP